MVNEVQKTLIQETNLLILQEEKWKMGKIKETKYSESCQTIQSSTKTQIY